MIKYVENFKDYEVLDCGNGEKIERFAEYILRRPDPQAIWHTESFNKYKVNAIYHRSSKGGGMPPRPLFRPVLVYMRKHVNDYYRNYLKDLKRLGKKHIYI